jgi:hypothetical protein
MGANRGGVQARERRKRRRHNEIGRLRAAAKKAPQGKGKTKSRGEWPRPSACTGIRPSVGNIFFARKRPKKRRSSSVFYGESFQGSLGSQWPLPAGGAEMHRKSFLWGALVGCVSTSAVITFVGWLREPPTRPLAVSQSVNGTAPTSGLLAREPPSTSGRLRWANDHDVAIVAPGADRQEPLRRAGCSGTFQSVPRDWQRHDFNGGVYYIVPLAARR